VCSDCGFSSQRWSRVVTHEYGHAIGIQHTGATSSVMYTSACCSGLPNQDDINALNTKYWCCPRHYEGFA
jgi:predicted Zn-dependent protease